MVTVLVAHLVDNRVYKYVSGFCFHICATLTAQPLHTFALLIQYLLSDPAETTLGVRMTTGESRNPVLMIKYL